MKFVDKFFQKLLELRTTTKVLILEYLQREVLDLLHDRHDLKIDPLITCIETDGSGSVDHSGNGKSFKNVG